MYKHLLILPDGAELFSGEEQTDALQTVKLTYAVNNGEELTLGSVCSAAMEATVLLAEDSTQLEAGIPIQVYAVDDARQRTLLGVFYLEKPARPNGTGQRKPAGQGLDPMAYGTGSLALHGAGICGHGLQCLWRGASE